MKLSQKHPNQGAEAGDPASSTPELQKQSVRWPSSESGKAFLCSHEEEKGVHIVDKECMVWRVFIGEKTVEVLHTAH